jgi:hypothetical protein
MGVMGSWLRLWGLFANAGSDGGGRRARGLLLGVRRGELGGPGQM